MNEDRDLQVDAVVASVNDKPYIRIVWGKSEGVLSVPDARNRGMALLQAAAIAEAEARVFEIIMPPKRGFSPTNPDKRAKEAILTLREARKQRTPLPPDINPIYGFNNREPLIEYAWGEEKGILDLDAARDHARGLIEAAEAAEKDSFFYYFFTTKHHIFSRNQTEEFLQEFKLFRQQNLLEKLFEQKSDRL
jgi:hypothetical protein